MSNIVSRGPDRTKGAGVAITFGVLWGLLIGAMWWGLKQPDLVPQVGGLFNWVARFHVVILHIPIALLFVVVIMEFFARFKRFGELRQGIVLILWLAFLGAIGATVLGYLLMGVEQEAGKAMTLHMWTGLGVVVLSLIALVCKLRRHGFLYTISLLAAAVCVAAAGHYGGAMVHEADYLSEYGPEPLKPLILAGLADPKAVKEEVPEEIKESPITEKIVFTDYVIPILENKCNECHNENKIKGKLRMDTHELLLAGAEGSDFSTVVPGNIDESELIVRVLLPHDDDDFMPPKGDGLAPEEIAVLKWWIQAGAKQETTVGELGEDPTIVETVEMVAALHAAQDEPEDTWEPVWITLSEEEQAQRIATAQAEAERLNISIMPISATDARFRVNALNGASEFGDEEIQILAPIAEKIAWLDVAKTQITDQGIDVIRGMRNLEKLHLENTKITDEGIARLTPLKRLHYLNLYGTDVSDEIFYSFRQMPGLRKIYLWQTKIDPAKARTYEESVNLQINTGIDLEVAAAETKAKKEAEKKAKAEEDARKKVAAEAEAKKKAEAKKLADEAARQKREADAAAAKASADAKAKAKADGKAKSDAKKKADAAAKAKPAAAAGKPAPAPAPPE